VSPTDSVIWTALTPSALLRLVVDHPEVRVLSALDAGDGTQVVRLLSANHQGSRVVETVFGPTGVRLKPERDT
jgi:hypothetical protein